MLSKCGLATISPEIITTNVLPLWPHIYGHASRNHKTNLSFSLLKSVSLPRSFSIFPSKRLNPHSTERSPHGLRDGGLSRGRNRRIPALVSPWKQGIREGIAFLWRRDELQVRFEGGVHGLEIEMAMGERDAKP